MLKIPKVIYINESKVKVVIDPKLSAYGEFNYHKALIRLNPACPNIEATFLHEIIEFIAASMYLIKDTSKYRKIVFLHSPDKSEDNFSTFINILFDTIRRNKLDNIFKE